MHFKLQKVFLTVFIFTLNPGNWGFKCQIWQSNASFSVGFTPLSTFSFYLRVESLYTEWILIWSVISPLHHPGYFKLSHHFSLQSLDYSFPFTWLSTVHCSLFLTICAICLVNYMYWLELMMYNWGMLSELMSESNCAVDTWYWLGQCTGTTIISHTQSSALIYWGHSCCLPGLYW